MYLFCILAGEETSLRDVCRSLIRVASSIYIVRRLRSVRTINGDMTAYVVTIEVAIKAIVLKFHN